MKDIYNVNNLKNNEMKLILSTFSRRQRAIQKKINYVN